MQMISLVWGVLAFLGMIVGFIPCFGALNWINIPFAVVGFVISVVALAKAGPEKGSALVGLVCCVAAIIIGFLRLTLGGGVV